MNIAFVNSLVHIFGEHVYAFLLVLLLGDEFLDIGCACDWFW